MKHIEDIKHFGKDKKVPLGYTPMAIINKKHYHFKIDNVFFHIW